jgi:hypothetical protein
MWVGVVWGGLGLFGVLWGGLGWQLFYVISRSFEQKRCLEIIIFVLGLSFLTLFQVLSRILDSLQ